MDKQRPLKQEPPQTAPNSGRRSAFEMSINHEFQVDAPPLKVENPQAGDLCPNCQSAKIDYDGLLNLSCPKCGFALAGCFT